MLCVPNIPLVHIARVTGLSPRTDQFSGYVFKQQSSWSTGLGRHETRSKPLYFGNPLLPTLVLSLIVAWWPIDRHLSQYRPPLNYVQWTTIDLHWLQLDSIGLNWTQLAPIVLSWPNWPSVGSIGFCSTTASNSFSPLFASATKRTIAPMATVVPTMICC